MKKVNLCKEVLENAIGVYKNLDKCGFELQPLDIVAVQAMEELLKYRYIVTVEKIKEELINDKRIGRKSLEAFLEIMEKYIGESSF